MNLLFSHLDRLDTQVILKRLTDRSITLSPDDLVLEGGFSEDIIAALSRGFPPPLSFTVQVNDAIDHLRYYSAFEWQQSSLLFCGISLLPFSIMQEQVEFENAWQYIRLLTSTEAGSILKPWLAIKPKGLIAATRTHLEFILPMHRMDFLLAWLNRLLESEIDLNWLSGTTGELDQELLTSVGIINQSRLPILQTWIERTSGTDDLDFNQLFSRSMIALG